MPRLWCDGDLTMEQKLIRLQAMGWGPGTPVRDIRIGDRLMWNFGYVSEVLDIVPVGKHFLNFTLRSEDGSIWLRRMKKDRLVARCKA